MMSVFAREKVVIGSVGVLLLAGTLQATDKRDYQKAAGANQGCPLIPYDDLSDRCRDGYKEQSKWCVGEAERGCSDLNKADPKDREIAKQRRDSASECIRARTYQISIFEDSVSRLKSEKSSSSDDELKSLIDTILDKTSASIQSHKDSLPQIENRRSRCDEVYNNR